MSKSQMSCIFVALTAPITIRTRYRSCQSITCCRRQNTHRESGQVSYCRLFRLRVREPLHIHPQGDHDGDEDYEADADAKHWFLSRSVLVGPDLQVSTLKTRDTVHGLAVEKPEELVISGETVCSNGYR